MTVNVLAYHGGAFWEGENVRCSASTESRRGGSTSIELQMKSGREKSLERRHPWIFSGAILGADGEHVNGDVVDVVSGRGDWLGRGL